MARSRYPDFDVLDQAEAWDETTRRIVLKRLDPPKAPVNLGAEETATLSAIVRHLLFEEREELIAFVVLHFDGQCGETVGESDRKTTVPPAKDLIKNGLQAIDNVASTRHGARFADCSVEDQFRILADLQSGKAGNEPTMRALPQKDLFKKLLSLAVEAFASHPRVWSEMGYAGPAYPRGYYRIERKVTDPWEPREKPEAAGNGRSNGHGG